ALRSGSMTIVEASAAILAFERELDGQRMLCVFNLSNAPAAFAGGDGWHAIEIIGDVDGDRFGPFAARVAICDEA
ncbi:alpha-glucosidase C-terminal domain-containing protein, partial [Campylobacter jejuni]